MISLKDRSSLRGLKKCNGCGNWNGIRANSCKNGTCKHFVKKSSIQNIPLIEPVELIYDEEASKLYSVRVRDRGIESRSFVKITDKTLSTDEKGCVIYRNAICYVDTCKYDSNDVNISCKHVKYASITLNKSSVLKVRKDVLGKICSTEDAQEELWNFYNANVNTTPVVQRISKYSFIVKCNVTMLFPTGFLHVYLSGNNSEVKYTCACKKRVISLTENDSVVLKNDKCDHLIYVMSAILSDDRLLVEFSKHLNLFLADNHLENKFVKSDNLNEKVIQRANGFILDDAILFSNDLNNLELIDCQIELMDQFKLTDHIDLSHSDIELTESDLLSTENIFNNNTIIEIPSNREPSNTNAAEPRKNIEIPSLDFVNWLDSVIERINNSMDFNCDGNVNDLSFIIPEKFFEYLREKFSLGVKCRLPNATQILQSGKHAGLIKHTWKFSRSDILMQIFSTENIKIQVEQKYIRTAPGMYTLLEEDESDVSVHTDNYCKIQPSVYKTYLKLGQDGQKDSLVLEWIPNILKKCKFGELNISFKFGHKKHNQIIKKTFKTFR